MFTGRLHELNRIDDSLLRLRDGNPSHLMLVGERGIGKSSLLLFTNALASGQVTWQSESTFNYVPVQFNVEKTLTRIGVVRKIKTSIERHLRKRQTFEKERSL
jgi:predicted ATPase